MNSQPLEADSGKLEKLGKQPGTLAPIFGEGQNKFQGPAKLRRLIVDLVDAESW